MFEQWFPLPCNSKKKYPVKLFILIQIDTNYIVFLCVGLHYFTFFLVIEYKI